jgi:hypothetical protein
VVRELDREVRAVERSAAQLPQRLTLLVAIITDVE